MVVHNQRHTVEFGGLYLGRGNFLRSSIKALHGRPNRRSLESHLRGGSFLDRFREVLEIDENLPEEDTPFNPDAFLASSGEINKARKKLLAGGFWKSPPLELTFQIFSIR